LFEADISLNNSLDNVVIIGCGDIGHRVAALWLQRGDQITNSSVTTTSRQAITSRHKSSVSSLVSNLVLDLDDPQSGTDLKIDNAVVFYFVPPPKDGVIDTRISHFISRVKQQKPARLIYISTSGVYGDCAGKWITEDEPTKPSSDRSRRRLNAEEQLKSYCRLVAAQLVILRVPGIYGAGRLPVERIKQGRPVVKDHTSYTNRIHEDDLARICVAAGDFDRPAGLFNISDGVPGTMAQYFMDIAKARNLPLPPEISWQQAQQEMSAEMLSYLAESRRIDNKKMLREFGIKLLYPDLAAGLKAC